MKFAVILQSPLEIVTLQGGRAKVDRGKELRTTCNEYIKKLKYCK